MVFRLAPLLLLLFVVLPLAQITRARAVDVDPTDFLPSGSGVLRTVQGDVDGDGRDDLVTLYALPSQGSSPPHASVLVLLQADDGPKPIHLFGKPPSDLRGEPILDPDGSTDLALRDLTGDGRSEILLTVTNRFQNTSPEQLVWVFGRGDVPPARKGELVASAPPWAGTGFRLDLFVEGKKIEIGGPSDPGGSAIVRQDEERAFTGPSPREQISETYRWRNDGFRLTERSLTLPPDTDLSGSPETAVLGFYLAVGRGDDDAAAALLDESIRTGVAPDPFADPGATLPGLRIDEVRLIDNGGSQRARASSTQSVYVRGSADAPGERAGQRQSFAGFWRVRPDGDYWRLAGAELHQTVDLAALADALPSGSPIIQTASGDLRGRGVDDYAVLTSAPGRFTLVEPYVILASDTGLQPAVPLSSFVKEKALGGPAGQLRISDVTGDGRPEITFEGIVGAHSEVLWVIGWNGTTLAPFFEMVSNNPSMSLTDLDGDGIPEIRFGQSGYCGSYASSPVMVFAFRWEDGAYHPASSRYPEINDGLDDHASGVLAAYPTDSQWNGARACVYHMLATANAFRGKPAEMREQYRSYASLRLQTDAKSPWSARPIYLADAYVEDNLMTVLAAAESGASPGWGPSELAILHDLLGDVLDTRAQDLEQQAQSADKRGQAGEAATARQESADAKASARQEYQAALALDPSDAEAQRALGQ
jgi:hypothetical protein